MSAPDWKVGDRVSWLASSWFCIQRYSGSIIKFDREYAIIDMDGGFGAVPVKKEFLQIGGSNECEQSPQSF